MRQIDNTNHVKIRTPERPIDEAGVALPKRVPGTSLFQGWGPKLMVAAVAIGALAIANRPANAATVVAQAACENHAATLISSPAFGMPEGVAAGGEAIVRIDLSATGQLQNVAIAQSSGDALLDFTATSIARESRFAPEVADCKPAAGSYLYRVTF
jgi:TonB family protein